MECQTVAAWTRQGYVALLPISPAVQVPHQELCSKETQQEDKEGKDREISELQQGGGQDACTRPHSGIKHTIINKVNKNSTQKEDNNKRNETDNETTIDKEEASIGGGSFSMPSSDDNCKGGIDSAMGEGLMIDSYS